MRASHLEDLLLGAALAAALVSWTWLGRRSLAQPRAHHTDGLITAAGSAYVPMKLPVGAAPRESWPPPVAQARGAEWIYDVFTPPEISYDEGTRQFVVTPPADGPEADAPGIELVAVKHEPFRLQLIGYVGGEGHYRGVFENPLTTEVWLGDSGRAAPAPGVLITDFTVTRRPVRLTEASVSTQPVAIATVQDEQTGRSLTLTGGEVAFADGLSATLDLRGDEEESLRELHVGEEFQQADRTFKITRLQLDPPSAELTQLSPASPQAVRLSLKVPPPAPVAAN